MAIRIQNIPQQDLDLRRRAQLGAVGVLAILFLCLAVVGSSNDTDVVDDSRLQASAAVEKG